MQASRRPTPKRPQTRIKPQAWYRSPWPVFGGAALVALLLYLPTLRYGFVWDDRTLIQDNPFLGRANAFQIFTGEFWNNPDAERAAASMSYYRPLANLSLYVDRKIWGLRPAGYHLTNVLINAAVVFLMCLLLRKLFGSVRLAGLGGLLVGIHPAMNCAVTFISNRTYLLALFFLLVGSYALLRGQHGRARFWQVLFGGSLWLSALALEASLVFAVIAVGWILVNRARHRPLSVWMTAIALPMAAYLLLRLGIARVPVAGSDLVMKLAIAEPLRIINTFGQQLQLLFFPFNQKIICVTGRSLTSFSVYTVLGLLFLGLPLYALSRLRRPAARVRDTRGAGSNAGPGHPAQPENEARRLGWYGYAWMVLFLLPFTHLVFLGPAGRMLYLAAPGVLILLAVLYRAFSHKRLTARIAYGAILLYTVLLAVQTLRRNPIWRDELSLNRMMVREAPASAVGHLNYGLALAEVDRNEEAIEHYRTAARLSPDYDKAHLTLALALMDRGDMSGAIPELREVVRLRPASPNARNDLAVALTRDGRLDSAIAVYREALRLDPNSVLTLNNLGYAYMESGDFRQAITYLRVALRLDPGLASARADLAAAYRAAGMPDSAALVEGGR